MHSEDVHSEDVNPEDVHSEDVNPENGWGYPHAGMGVLPDGPDMVPRS